MRDTAAEVIAAAAKNYHLVHQAPLPGSSTNGFMKVVLEGMHVQQREVQTAAASALCQMAPHIGPLDPTVSKQLLRLLTSTPFHAKPFLLHAFASATEDGDGTERGFLTQGLDGILPILGSLIGSPAKPPPIASSGTPVTLLDLAAVHTRSMRSIPSTCRDTVVLCICRTGLFGTCFLHSPCTRRPSDQRTTLGESEVLRVVW